MTKTTTDSYQVNFTAQKIDKILTKFQKHDIVEEKELGIFYETNKLKRGLSSSPAYH